MSYKLLITKSYTKKLIKFFKRHPDVLKRYAKTMEILEMNPFHPSLRMHKLQGKLGEYHSISINLEYRIVIDFIVQNEEIIPVDIGTYNEVY